MSCCGSAPPLLWTLEPLSSFPAYANLCSKQKNNIIIIITITRKKQNKLYSTFCSKSKYSCVMQASRTSSSTKDRKDTLVNTAFMKAKNTTMPDDGRQRHDNSILPSYNIHSDEPVTGTLRLLRQLRAWCQWRVTCDVWIYQTRDVSTARYLRPQDDVRNAVREWTLIDSECPKFLIDSNSGLANWSTTWRAEALVGLLHVTMRHAGTCVRSHDSSWLEVLIDNRKQSSFNLMTITDVTAVGYIVAIRFGFKRHLSCYSLQSFRWLYAVTCMHRETKTYVWW